MWAAGKIIILEVEMWPVVQVHEYEWLSKIAQDTLLNSALLVILQDGNRAAGSVM